MNRKSSTILASSTLTILFFAAFAAAQTYQGRATSVRATVNVVGQPLVSTAVSDTGNLPDAGGGTSLTGTSASAAGILSVGSSNASTSGASGLSSTIAGVNNLSLTALSNSIGATAVSTTAQASCPNGAISGGTVITGLTVNGGSVTVTGAANQSVTVFLLGSPVGTLIINEQIVSPSSITVNALHLYVTDPGNLTVTDVIVASSSAAITCASPPPSNRFSGFGNAVWLAQTSVLNGQVATIIADTGALPGGGGSLNSSTAGAGLGSLLSTGAVTASSSGGAPGGNPNSDQSAARVNNLGVNALNTVTISANVLNSNTQCQCGSTPTCSGNSTVTGLAVTTPLGPLTVNVTGNPNQAVTLPLGLGSLIINEQVNSSLGSRFRKTVTALHVRLNVAGLDQTEIKVADSDSGISCGFAPSAANVSVSGMVGGANGMGLSGAIVTFTDTDGDTFSTRTNPFGYFRLDGVPSGMVYVATVSHKKTDFAPQLVSVEDEITGLAFFPMNRKSDTGLRASVDLAPETLLTRKK